MRGHDAAQSLAPGGHDEIRPPHQWWGHAVSWASYHDQWLSEGFAEFSASLFVQYGQGPGHQIEYRQFWDEGPLWMGLRLDSPKAASAYRHMIYPKGAYVWTQDGDRQFIEMMHDFVATHRCSSVDPRPDSSGIASSPRT